MERFGNGRCSRRKWKPAPCLDFHGNITYNTAMKKKIGITIISFTESGSLVNAALKKRFQKEGIPCEGYSTQRFAEKSPGLEPLPKNIREWIGEFWGKRGFIFIGASGIAVRYIAPWVRDKFTDSPVVVMDEKEQFVIPLLSGHAGGAVELARQLAAWTGAVPVITTATDVQEKFAVDVFAGKNGMCITDRGLAKAISAAVLEGKKIGFYSSLPISGKMPEELEQCQDIKELKKYSYGIAVTLRDAPATGPVHGTPLTRTPCQEIPGILRLYAEPGIVVGLGCRRGTKREQLESGLALVLEQNHIHTRQIEAFASIELKKDEEGILALAEAYEVPFYVFSAEELKTIETVSSHSAFVEQTTGVDNVCERAAVFACQEGALIQPKICADGCTYALVARRRSLSF
ncbi:MAG: cobalamin biosynthesis protein [Faecalicatena sp.]|nr:cobalamin biosynthesis protein [Faecalicatena sp.]MCI6468279.1 cobalamin biosynthesis protein [Faecalicatena sp.]